MLLVAEEHNIPKKIEKMLLLDGDNRDILAETYKNIHTHNIDNSFDSCSL